MYTICIVWLVDELVGIDFELMHLSSILQWLRRLDGIILVLTLIDASH